MSFSLLEGKPKRRSLKTGAKITQADLQKGKKPPGVLWGDWGPALKAFKKGGGSKKKKAKPVWTKAKPKKPSAQRGWTSKPKQPKLTQPKRTPKEAAFAALAAQDPFYGQPWGDPEPKPMGVWGLGGGKQKKWKMPPAPPKPKLTPDQQKLRDMITAFLKKYGTIQREAAGGLVIRSWKAASPHDLECLVAKTHAKWGTPHWILPKGGVDVGESLHQGAVREVREETNVRAKVVGDRPWKKKGWSGSQADYDVERVVHLMKRMFPKDKRFIAKMMPELRKSTRFRYANMNHYFLMEYVSGTPGADKHQETSGAQWMRLADAYKIDYRIKAVIKFLTPQVQKRWIPTGEAPKGKGKTSLSSLREPRKPKVMKVHKQGKAPKASTGGLPWSTLF